MVNIKNYIKILFSLKSNNTYIQFFRYFFVGGVAFLIDTGATVYLTDYIKIYYIASVTLGFMLGIIVNYILSSIWVFHRNTKTVSKKQHFVDIIIFSVIGVIGLLLTLIIIWFLFDILNFSILFSKIISSVIVLFWNFLGRKYLVFHRKEILKNLKQ